MNIIETLLSAQGGDTVRQVAGRFGLDENQAASAIAALVPVLAGGLHSNATAEGGLGSLISALENGNHGRFLDDPSAVASDETVEEGNSILGHVLGSKDASRQVASAASDQTGISSDVMKQMLPVVATMVMGALSKHSQQSATPAAGVLGALAGFLDSNKDGNIADDVLGMVGKFFQK